MATIGTFTASNNSYTGSIKTLTPNVKPKFVTTEKDNEGARLPHLCGSIESVGASSSSRTEPRSS